MADMCNTQVPLHPQSEFYSMKEMTMTKQNDPQNATKPSVLCIPVAPTVLEFYSEGVVRSSLALLSIATGIYRTTTKNEYATRPVDYWSTLSTVAYLALEDKYSTIVLRLAPKYLLR
jgi:hypothetical protein